MISYILAIDLSHIITSLPVFFIFFILIKTKTENRIMSSLKIFIYTMVVVRITELLLFIFLSGLMFLENSNGDLIKKIWTSFGLIENISIMFSLGLFVYGIWLNNKEGALKFD